MKTIRSIIIGLVLITATAIQAHAQQEAKVIAVINKADWCHVCVNNEERAKSVFKENNKDGVFNFIVNDVTDQETRRTSKQKLDEVGLGHEVERFKYTGLVYFFNAETKEFINQVSIAKSDKELTQTLTVISKSL